MAAGREMTTDAEPDIRARIGERGRVTFAEFMEAALYDPRGGYYTGAGPDVDYYTSPAAHPAFGALIAVQLSRMWEALGRPGCFTAVEMGAGGGLLARDVVSYARRALSPFAGALRYVTVDRARPSQAVDAVRHVVASRMPAADIVGCVLSNELLDAFPVHRFGIRGGRVLEVYVVVRGGRFAEELDEPSTPELAAYVERLGVELPEGFRGELNTGIAPWMADVAQALERGFVLTIDYGYVREEVEPVERGDTVQGYYRHTGGASPYDRVGEQDLTAHVDFTHVVEEGSPRGAAGPESPKPGPVPEGDGVERLAGSDAPRADAGVAPHGEPDGDARARQARRAWAASRCWCRRRATYLRSGWTILGSGTLKSCRCRC